MATITQVQSEQSAIATGSPRRNRLSLFWKAHRGWLTALGILVLIFVFWGTAVSVFGISPLIVPTPQDTLVALGTGLSSGVYLTALLATFEAAFLGFALALVLALAVGLLVTFSDLARGAFYPYVIGLQAFPKIAVAPLLVIWFGYGLQPKVLVAALVAFLPLLTAVEAGLRSPDKDQLDLMASVGASRWQLFRMVRFPSSLPYLFVGLQAGIISALLGAIVAEFVGSTTGVGVLLLNMNSSFDSAGVFSILILLGVIGTALYLILDLTRRKVVFWVAANDREISIKE